MDTEKIIFQKDAPLEDQIELLLSILGYSFRFTEDCPTDCLAIEIDVDRLYHA